MMKPKKQSLCEIENMKARKQNNGMEETQKWNLSILMLLIVFFLYFFLSSISILTVSFRLLSEHHISGSILKEWHLENPELCLIVGIVSTVLIQSSSTTTSIVVAMAASGAISVRQGIPFIMGANVGTSITSTLISLSNIKENEEYMLGFTAALLHSLFNWLTVLFLLPLEIFTNFLEKLSEFCVQKIGLENNSVNHDMFHMFEQTVNPLVHSLILLDTKSCVSYNTTQMEARLSQEETFEAGNAKDYIEDVFDSSCSLMKKDCDDGCNYLFYGSSLSDIEIGIILLVVSFLIFIICYICLVKCLKAVLSNHLVQISRKLMNKDFHIPRWLASYFVLLFGMLLTICIQSSSVVTAILVPVVSLKLISFETAYQLTLGANLGTTTTCILAALSSGAQHPDLALQMALCHMFFNLFGVLLLFPIPFLRMPLFMANKMGKTVIKYKWFSIFYILLFFVVGPFAIYGLSLLNTVLMYVVVISIIALATFVVIVNYFQENNPNRLPNILRNWLFLPKHLRSFSTIDYVVMTLMEVYCCCVVSRTVAQIPMIVGGMGIDNQVNLDQVDLRSVKVERKKIILNKNISHQQPPVSKTVEKKRRHTLHTLH